MEISLPEVVAALFVVFLLLVATNLSRASKVDTTRENLSLTELRSVTDEDSWEGSFAEAESPRKLSVNLHIEYVDGAGSASSRNISVHEFDNDLHGGILIAHCHLRDAMRTFRFSRIRSCSNLDKGDSVDDVAVYLNNLYEEKLSVAS